MVAKANEAERGVIGCILLDGASFFKAVGVVRAEDFTLLSCRRIWGACYELYTHKKTIDLISIIDVLNEQGVLMDIGGVDFLVQLQNGVAIPTHITQYCEAVREASQKRRAVRVASNLQQNIDKRGVTEGVTYTVSDLLSVVRGGNCCESLRNIAEKYYKELEDLQTSYMYTGHDLLDHRTGGIKRGRFWVISAYSGTGKTMFAVQVARNILRQNKRVVFYSLEMSDVDIFERFKRVHELSGGNEEDMYDWDLRVVTNKRSWDDIYVDFLADESRPDLVILDFAQKVRIRGRTLYERMDNLADRVQDFTKNEKTAFLLLSQVSNEQAKSEFDGFANAKGGGEIFAASDVFIEIRADKKRELEEKTAHAMDKKNNNVGFTHELVHARKLILVKNRFGLEAIFDIDYMAEYGKGVYVGI